MGKVTIKCGCCKGTGRVPLTGTYKKTLALLKQATRNKPEAYAASLAQIDGCNATAMNNRLARLVELGLAKARRDGRIVWYRPAQPKETA